MTQPDTALVIPVLIPFAIVGVRVAYGVIREINKQRTFGKFSTGKMYKVSSFHPNAELASEVVIVKQAPFFKDQVFVQLYNPKKRRREIISGYYGLPQAPGNQYEDYDDYMSRWMDKNYLKVVPVHQIIKKGGEKKVRRMPRLYRSALYLALVVLVWHVVLNIDFIFNYVIQNFILHK